MKKLSAILLVLALFSCAIGAGENSKITASKSGFFPNLSGIDLEGKMRELPQAFDKKINIVVVAFKREQQENVNGWIKVADEIMLKNSDVGFYELPVIYELGSWKRSFINNGMRRGVVGEQARKRTITVYTDRQKFFEMMKMEENKIYLLVIDSSGKIKQKIEGDATEINVKSLKKKWRF